MARENQRPQKSTISKTKLTVNRPAASVIRGKQANASECTKSTGRLRVGMALLDGLLCADGHEICAITHMAGAESTVLGGLAAFLHK